jgi:hypothetical protein
MQRPRERQKIENGDGEHGSRCHGGSGGPSKAPRRRQGRVQFVHAVRGEAGQRERREQEPARRVVERGKPRQQEKRGRVQPPAVPSDSHNEISPTTAQKRTSGRDRNPVAAAAASRNGPTPA